MNKLLIVGDLTRLFTSEKTVWSSTKLWYARYQIAVARLPSVGRQATKHWYAGYQTPVGTLPVICSHSTGHLYAQYKASVHTVQSICTHSTIDIKVTVEIERPELPAGQFRSLLVV